VEAAGDICGLDQWQQAVVVADGVGPKSLGNIGIEVNQRLHDETSCVGLSRVPKVATSDASIREREFASLHSIIKMPGDGVVKVLAPQLAAARLLAAGDTAITVEFGTAATRVLSAQVLALDRRLAAQAAIPGTLPGIIETVPTMRSLTVYYDPLITSFAALSDAITPLLPVTAEDETASRDWVRQWTLPVCYSAAMAPDLADVAATTGLTVGDVIRLHTATTYRVYMLGFLPGQAYLGDLDPALHLPRRSTPRTAVPQGSVAIATSMATVYPLESPGGWHLIGRCPVRLFDAQATNPVLLAPADTVRFRAIGDDEWAALSQASADGTWRLEPVAIGGRP
jgi:inhibitor of KinA